ncbi:MAG: hypothetical protein P4L42_01665 [Desulfocapsaceae bacterium]|nr:hypothetical protein [Desulfocapsaceae bacterium]
MVILESLWRKHQYGVLVGFVHHLAYFRAASRIYGEWGKKSEFWVRTIDAHLIRCVIDWCMVFGTDSNQIHWKKVVTSEIAQDEFRQVLCDFAGLPNTEWKAYWEKMIVFRNDFAAHRITADVYPAVPYMDKALLVATTYDEWVRKQLQISMNAIFDEPTLADRYARIIRTIETPMRKLIGLGPIVKDEYEGNPP